MTWTPEDGARLSLEIINAVQSALAVGMCYPIVCTVHAYNGYIMVIRYTHAPEPEILCEYYPAGVAVPKWPVQLYTADDSTDRFSVQRSQDVKPLENLKRSLVLDQPLIK